MKDWEEVKVLEVVGKMSSMNCQSSREAEMEVLVRMPSRLLSSSSGEPTSPTMLFYALFYTPIPCQSIHTLRCDGKGGSTILIRSFVDFVKRENAFHFSTSQ